MSGFSLSTGLTLMGLASATALATTPPIITEALSADPDDQLIGNINTGTSIERYLADLIQPIRAHGKDGEFLTKADIDTERRKELADARASALALALRFDLNGDAIITREEVEQGQEPRNDWVRGSKDRLFDQYDLNNDGKITVAEINDVTEEEGRQYQADRLEALLSLDPNKDGRLTVAELSQLGRSAFTKIDTDGNGLISADEYRASEPARQRIRDASRRMQLERFGSRCLMAAAVPHDQIIAVGVYGAQTLSPLAIGGQDQATDFTVVHIEKGNTPLYVVLTSYEGMLWKFEGDVRRISRVAVASFTKTADRIPAVGVAGVKANQVTFLRGDCLHYFSNTDSNEGLQAHGVIRRSLRRAPDKMFASHSAMAVSLPSGAFENADRKNPPPAPASFDSSAWSDAIRFWPAGIGEVQKGAVVSGTSIANYDVFPSQFGIAQLLGNGSILRGPKGELRIVRPLPRFPAQMFGSHSERLFLAPGVPMPAGDPGHSCIKREDGSGAPIGATCRH
jgi:hypothetical protein